MMAWLIHTTADPEPRGRRALQATGAQGGPAPRGAASTRSRTRRLVVGAATALVAASTVSHAQPAGAPTAPAPQEQAAPSDTAPTGQGLGDLDAMTLGCSKASLNAAAREAAKVPSEGTYQFSYFRIVNDSHHAAYEVHFKSNHEGEADLKYCVAIYCQQGWDPKTTQISVSRMGAERQRGPGAVHGAACRTPAAPVKSPTKR